MAVNDITIQATIQNRNGDKSEKSIGKISKEHKAQMQGACESSMETNPQPPPLTEQ